MSVVLAALIAAAPRVAAATFYVRGHLTGTNTWLSNNTYVLTANVTVDPSATLTIQPSVTVDANLGVRLYVDGALWANGTPAFPITFQANGSARLWSGIEFNGSARGSVQYSHLDRADTAITATSSSPSLANNVVTRSATGFRLLNSAALSVIGNSVDRGTVGIDAAASSGVIQGNTINGTAIGIQAQATGSLTLRFNTITNITTTSAVGGISFGIYVNGLNSVTLNGNSVQHARGLDGSTPSTPSGRGTDGTFSMGIIVNGTGAATLSGNSVDDVAGGRGGDGAASTVGPGGNGGTGASGLGILVTLAQTASVQSNTVTDIAGGRGGNGGSSSGASGGNGGSGGVGGSAVGIEVFSITSSMSGSSNFVATITGGLGGMGGSPSLVVTGHLSGKGGLGGDAYGIAIAQAMSAFLSANNGQTVAGGAGGNSTAAYAVATSAYGGGGGQAVGIAILAADGPSASPTTLHGNVITAAIGGRGGTGRLGGAMGGNATGALIFGDGTPFNATSASANRISSITGGQGGDSINAGGDGGGAAGLVASHVTPTFASNFVSGLEGGNGGNASVGKPGGLGGQSAGFAFDRTSSGSSSLDQARMIANGSAGGGTPQPATYGVGFFFLGTSSDRTTLTVTNGTLSAVSSYDLYVDNYTRITTVNTPFGWSSVRVEAAGNLTVRNFLSVHIRWPNNVTYLSGASITVLDNAATVWSLTSPSGQASWLLVTDRIYVDSSTPTENTTQVSVAFPGYSFARDPRLVNMSASHPEYFVMTDTVAPTSAANPLPAYETSRSFPVAYTASDGNGVGLSNVTLWYRAPGTGWVRFAVQATLGSGQFAFVATVDGPYAFVTIAADTAGNTQVFPVANNTWTIVDTTPPGTHVVALPPYETSLSFLLTWVPDTNVTDVANFTIQVNAGTGWVTWLANATATSGSYTAAGQGPVAFRSLARDRAGNVESKSSNDTWTLVDTIPPQVLATSPVGNLTKAANAIVITFSESMNESAVQAAFGISPITNGTFTWSNGSRVLTFQPTQGFPAGTTFTVTVGTGAFDREGNALARAVSFSFSTAPPVSTGLSLGSLWPALLAVVLIAGALAGFFLLRRRGASAAEDAAAVPAAPVAAVAPKPEAAIDDVFLLYRKDGVLIKHETRRLRPDIDTDILSGMLTAVQQFVKDSFRGDEGDELNEMTVGQMHILIGRGKYLILAATLTGGDMESMTNQIRECIADMEDHNWDRLEDWDGDMDLGKVLTPYLKKLIRNEYAA